MAKLAKPSPGPGKKRKVKETLPKKKVSPKKKRKVASKEDLSPIPGVSEPSNTRLDSLQPEARDLLQAHGFSLGSIFDTQVQDFSTRPPPNTKIPHTQSVAGDSTAPEEEWDDNSEDPDQIGRVEKRCMFCTVSEIYFQSLCMLR